MKDSAYLRKFVIKVKDSVGKIRAVKIELIANNCRMLQRFSDWLTLHTNVPTWPLPGCPNCWREGGEGLASGWPGKT